MIPARHDPDAQIQSTGAGAVWRSARPCRRGRAIIADAPAAVPPGSLPPLRPSSQPPGICPQAHLRRRSCDPPASGQAPLRQANRDRSRRADGPGPPAPASVACFRLNGPLRNPKRGSPPPGIGPSARPHIAPNRNRGGTGAAALARIWQGGPPAGTATARVAPRTHDIRTVVPNPRQGPNGAPCEPARAGGPRRFPGKG